MIAPVNHFSGGVACVRIPETLKNWHLDSLQDFPFEDLPRL